MDEVGEHVDPPRKSEGLQDLGDAAVALDRSRRLAAADLVPAPGVLEGLDLRGGAGAVLFGEEDVVVRRCC